ncbi:hypothetical protein RHECNPAF_990044 [Rhizobium etli CNPAF512]|nr:hypothetical protein RHECNPAF_990044 [Rhizobium etli CNPAF512]
MLSTVSERRRVSWRTRSMQGADEACSLKCLLSMCPQELSRLDPQDTVAQIEAAKPFDHTR